ncbi:MAG: hypothetical protein FWH36_09025 [Lentimicrobiaceae bacterium]|nr:hypothetical protein [Lentimicrobiaceae bacterium]
MKQKSFIKREVAADNEYSLQVMKKISKILLLGSFLFMFYGCPVPFDPYECSYEYPINITNLKDTIKITDTLWVENDFDASFCSNKVVFKNEDVLVIPTPMKLVNDSLVSYDFTIIKTEEVAEERGVKIRQQNGIYKLRYGIVFPDTGIYVFEGAKGSLYEEHTEVYIHHYFNTPSNNVSLLPEKLYDRYVEKPYNYHYYVICVIE